LKKSNKGKIEKDKNKDKIKDSITSSSSKKQPSSVFNVPPLYVQMGCGQQLAPGVTVIPHPPKWASGNNPFIYDYEVMNADVADVARGDGTRSGITGLVFVMLDEAHVDEYLERPVTPSSRQSEVLEEYESAYTSSSSARQVALNTFTVHPRSDDAVRAYYSESLMGQKEYLQRIATPDVPVRESCIVNRESCRESWVRCV